MDNYDLLEFWKLKDEQIGRLTYRDTLFYLTMVIIGGSLATVFSNPQASVILVVLPIAIFIAGVSHVTCDRRIEDIGNYIRERLSKSIAIKTNHPQAEIFAWENYFRETRWHPVRKMLQLLTSLALYSGAGVGALYLYLRLQHMKVAALPTPERVLWVLDVCLMVLMACVIVAFTYVKLRNRSDSRAEEIRAERRIRTVTVHITISAAAAGLTALAVIQGARFLADSPQFVKWMVAAGWQLPDINVVAALAAFFVWSVGLVVRKR